MKNFIFFLAGFICLLFCQEMQAQDVIYKVTGEEVKAKVVEITPEIIRFTQPEVHTDSVFMLPRSEVFMVKYANGLKELMQPVTEENTTEPVIYSDAQLYQQGRRDAKLYYKGNGAIFASMGATLLLGLPGTAIMAVIPPRVSPREVPNTALLANQHYYKGYRNQAHKRKVGKVALGAGITAMTLVVLLVSATSSH